MRTSLISLATLLAAQMAAGTPSSTDREEFFELKVRPVLTEYCVECHAGDKAENGFRATTREAFLKGGQSGPAIIPGDPEKSLLIKSLRSAHGKINAGKHGQFSDETIADFARWIREGAIWPEKSQSKILDSAAHRHWAFERVKRLDPPNDPTGWSLNPIDRFIQAKRAKRGLSPVRLADKRTLIRRVYFDLIGLPPSPEQIEAFAVDTSPNAYPQLIERLLGSPQYGERWGRYWMDVARYADTAGDNADYPIPEARLYRDYIIDSFNADKPYDQFVREQLAGDILARQGPPDKYAERAVATGFIALSRRYATAPFELWHLTLEDTIETTGRAFLGLTLRCARCHDHKFDPVTKEDYYALYGIFASTQYPYAGSEEFQSKNFPRTGFIPLAPPDQVNLAIDTYQREIQKLQASLLGEEKEGELPTRIADLSKEIEAQTKTAEKIDPAQRPGTETELASLRKQRDDLNKKLQEKLRPLRADLNKLQRPGAPRGLPVAYAVSEGKASDACVQVRGNPDEKGPLVRRRPPKFLNGETPFKIPDGSSGRLQLAEWMTRPENPLTARVMVNRIWQHHFGKGIVGTPSNFGLRGDPPTHPELLDFLANRFIESGWSVKSIHRMILLSKTYQLSSEHADENAAKDPANKFYWRFDRRRLDAESIHDAMLAIGGNLDLKRPGAQPFPQIETWTFTQHSPFKSVYESNCRSVFMMTQRFQRHPYLLLFDGPDPNTTTDTRTESTVPLQALFMMNNKFVELQAAGLARKLLALKTDANERLRMAVELAWSRLPRENEIAKANEFLKRYEAELTQAGQSDSAQELGAWTSYCRILLTANEFIYLD